MDNKYKKYRTLKSYLPDDEFKKDISEPNLLPDLATILMHIRHEIVNCYYYGSTTGIHYGDAGQKRKSVMVYRT